MKWVTIRNVKMDRTACAWLITRFLDRDAEFEFVDKDELQNAEAEGKRTFHNYVFTGTPRPNSGFQELVLENGLDKSDPAFVLMGQAIRAGERAGWAKDGSENYGLWAIANGITSLANGDDLKIIRGMMPVYDALYEYCKLRAAGESGWKSDM